MKKNSKDNLQKHKLIIVISILLFLFTGIIAGVFGISKIHNYYNPWFFTLICVLLGFLIGSLIYSYIKPYLLFKPNHSTLDIGKMYFRFGFIGFMIALGSIINPMFSELSSCDYYAVINKEESQYKFRISIPSSIEVNINGNIEKIYCSKDYWEKISIGKDINLCTYKSKLGFDFIALTDEK